MHIGVLGSVEAHLDGTSVPVGTPQQRCVLAVLALRAGECVSIERLEEVLWGEDVPPNARGLVQGYASRLRKVLRPHGADVLRQASGYVLTVARDHVDVHLFRDLVAQGLWAHALTLWRGEPLDGVTGSDALLRLRAGLAEERLVATEGWAKSELDAGNHRVVVGRLTELAAEHPLREHLIALAVLALHGCGRRAEALRLFDETRRELADQLGVGPGDELRELHERMLRADLEPIAPPSAPPARSGPNSLPFAIPDFTGRVPELAGLISSPPGITTIDGMAGVGKTALAVRAARELSRRHPDAQLFIDLHGFTPGRDPVEPAAALDTLLRLLGVPAEHIPADTDQRMLAWRAALAGLNAVVVLDNAADAAQVRPLIPGAPGCVVLVTSRRRMPTLEGAVPLSLDVLPDDEAAALVHAVAGAQAADDPIAVGELVELCGRLPLAIRIASARLQHRPQWTLADLVARLRTEQTRLSELAVDDRDLAGAFALSYDYLDPAARRTFRLLGAHPGTDLDLHAAAALCGLPPNEVLDQIEVLLDHHLIAQWARHRWAFHDLLRRHALALVDGDDERMDATTRLLDHYVRTAHHAADVLQPGRRVLRPDVPDAATPAFQDNESAMTWYRAEHGNLVAATLHAAKCGFDHHTCHLVRNTGHYLVIGHHIDDLITLQETATTAASRLGDPVLESMSAYHLALTHYMACNYRVGLGYASRNLSLTRAMGDESGEGWAFVVLGMLHHRLGELADAHSSHRAALALQERLGDLRCSALCVANVGRTDLALGRLDSARLLLEDAVERCRDIGERNEEASNLTTLGTVHSKLGHSSTAIHFLQAGLALARETGNTDYTVRGLIELADGLRRAGRVDDADVHARQAWEMLGHGRSADHLAEAANVLGSIALDRGDADGALAHHREALAIADRIEYRMEQAGALAGLAAALDHAGDPAAARAHRTRADDHYHAMGVHDVVVVDVTRWRPPGPRRTSSTMTPRRGSPGSPCS